MLFKDLQRPWVKRLTCTLLLLSLSGGTLLAPQTASAATPWEVLSSANGQIQLSATAALDLATSTSLLIVTGHWQQLSDDVDDWCNFDTALSAYRTRVHEPLTPMFNMPLLIWMGEMQQGIRGDWGMAYLLGWLGAVVGNRLVCAAYPVLDSPFIEKAMALVIPSVSAAVGSVYGFNFHADLDLGTNTQEDPTDDVN